MFHCRLADSNSFATSTGIYAKGTAWAWSALTVQGRRRYFVLLRRNLNQTKAPYNAGVVSRSAISRSTASKSQAAPFAETRTALPQLTDIQTELTEIHTALAQEHGDEEEHAELLARYGELQHRFEELGGFRADAEVAKVLTGLGFQEDQFERPVETFSGGWQMRIALAKLLLQQPEVLLLDEPTNHLDLDSLLWLEGYLHSYSGSIVIISRS